MLFWISVGLEFFGLSVNAENCGEMDWEKVKDIDSKYIRK